MNNGVRSYNPWIWLILPLWCLTFLILFPPHALDIAVSRLFWVNGDWPWHDNVFFSEVLHKGTKAVPIVIALYVLYQIAHQFFQRKSTSFNQEIFARYCYVFAAMALSVFLVWWFKQTSGVSCPWSVTEFGGAEKITDPQWPFIFRSGACWPGGHAGTGFCLFSLYFALRDRFPRKSYWVLGAVLVFGLICSATRTMQGAHFVSHNVATLLIDWLVCSGLYVICFDRKVLALRFKHCKPAKSFQRTVFLTALLWTLCFDWPFWKAMIASVGGDPAVIAQTLFLSFVLALSFFCLAVAVIELLGILPQSIFRLLMAVLSLSGVAALIASLLYGTTMTPDMVRNFLQTDSREAMMYFSISSLSICVFLLLPSGLLLLGGAKYKLSLPEQCRRAGLCALFLLIGVLLLMSQLQPFSALMRNDKSLRYLIAPFNVVYSTASTLLRDQNTDQKRERQIVDVNPTALTTPERPTVFVLVIGETARSANWQLAGYKRETTPRLASMDIINIPTVQACGTSTDVSLPCMLSRVGRRDYDRKRILSEESLPSLLQRSGLNVTWIDNQSGSKGTSDGVRTVFLNQNEALCAKGECMDMAFVDDLKARLSQLKNRERQVLILHMMGSHGPAYDQRSEDPDKVFGAVCTDPSFRSCSSEQIINAYDASIRYTDRVIAELIKTLSARKNVNTALIYVSDHGESLGENGLFLHGAPYYVSPDVQRIVPMVMWLSDEFKEDYKVSGAVIEKNIQKTVTHDHLYHTVLGLLNVKSSTYEKQWDLSAAQK